MAIAQDEKTIECEAGVIGTLFYHPEYYFFSENLKPSHFLDYENAVLYWAISDLAKKGFTTIEPYSVRSSLNTRDDLKEIYDRMTPAYLDELKSLSIQACASSEVEYQSFVSQVLDKSFRRETISSLHRCEKLCESDMSPEDLKMQISSQVDDIICSYQNIDELLPMSERIDDLWEKIQQCHDTGNFIEFKFPSLNRYTKLSRTDAIVIAAREKRGKSIFLLNCLVDLLNKGQRVLYIDTELDTKLFTMRLQAHLAQVKFTDIRDGTYTEEEYERILEANEWIKEKKFWHENISSVDDETIVSITKKCQHKYGLDVVILDYLKGNTAYCLDAYQNSATLGKTMDTLKNIIALSMNLYVLTAVQATNTGAIADSAKIIRNCSTLMYIERKTEEQIEADGGIEYGNMMINVRANRNGEIMGDNEYISLTLDGNHCTFYESLQPPQIEPY